MGINAEISQIGGKLSKKSREWENEIDQEEAQTNDLQNQNKQLRGLLDPKLLAVTINWKVNSQPVTKGGSQSNGNVYIIRPYLGKALPSQLAPGANGSLNSDLECQYCKDTGHHKENCIKLNCQMAQEQRKSEQNSTAPSVCATNLAN